MPSTDYIIHVFVLCVLMPAWLALGLADWLCHRAAQVETTAGPKESVIHLLLSNQAAVAIMAGLLLDINALVVAIMLAAFIAHEFTTHWDIRVAFRSRTFTTTEQRIHDYLTAIPFAALCLVMSTHLDQAAALFGLGQQPADLSLRWKDPALPTAYLAAWITASIVFNQIPFAEELLRGLRARSHG